MENASKALIIAGAILIAILLITIGILLINSGSGVAESGTREMASQEIQIFNSQFTPYEGTKKGSELKSLFSKVQASNATDRNHQVYFMGNTPTGERVKNVEKLESSRTYTVSFEYATPEDTMYKTEEGYIYMISIKK